MTLFKGEKYIETSAKSAGEQPVAIRLLLACGAIGPLLNIVALLILGVTRPGYSAWLIPDSSLARAQRNFAHAMGRHDRVSLRQRGRISHRMSDIPQNTDRASSFVAASPRC